MENDPLFNLYVGPTLGHAGFSSVTQVFWRLISDLKLLSDSKGQVLSHPREFRFQAAEYIGAPLVEECIFFSLQQ